MRSESDRGYQPHWEEFVAVSRDELQTKEIGYCGGEEEKGRGRERDERKGEGK